MSKLRHYAALTGIACLLAGASCGGANPAPAPGCAPKVTATLTTLYALQQSQPVYTGSCFTPNSDVAIENISFFTAPCRGIIVVPGTTKPVDGSGNFNFKLPMTIFGFTLQTGDYDMVFHDVGGRSAAVTLHFIDGGTSDTYIKPTDKSVPLAPVATSEHGSGTIVMTSEVAAGTGSTGGDYRADFQITLSGASPSTNYTVLLKALTSCTEFGSTTSDPQIRSFGTVMSDAAGNATKFFHAYLMGDAAPGYFAPTLSLTTDGNVPGASNVAYRGELTVVNHANFSDL